jgi:hypothetical protein
MTQSVSGSTAPPLDPDQPGFLPPGVAAEELPKETAPQQVDYFGFEETHRWYFPDGITYVDIKVLDEGTKSMFQKKTQRDVTLERGSGNARFAMDPAEERHELIKASVYDWNLIRGGQPIPLSTNASNNKANLVKWMESANPVLVENLEKFIREKNPWLQGEMSSKDIREEIDRLEKLYDETVAREQGEEYSSSR